MEGNMTRIYSDKLKNPKWQKKRLEILERDGFKCKLCGDEETELQVHHKKYSDGNPWDADDKNLITLCKHCHNAVTVTKDDGGLDNLKAFCYTLSPDHNMTVKIYKREWKKHASFHIYDDIGLKVCFKFPKTQIESFLNLFNNE